MLDFFHDNWLRCSALERFRWTNGEISKQGWLVFTLAIKVLAYQISRRIVSEKENVMGTDVPYLEKAIGSI